MRLARYSTPQTTGAPPRLGALTATDHVVDLAAAAANLPQAGLDGPELTDTTALLAAGPRAREAAQQLVETVLCHHARGTPLPGSSGHEALLDAAHVRLHPPVRPRRLRDYLTYPGHAAGAGLDVPPAMAAMPICYQGNTEAVLGPDDEVPWPAYTNQLDYELELAVVVGAGGRDLSVAQAAEHIGGWTLLNDVSARDIQLSEMSMGIGPGKGKAFANPLGPVVATPDEVDEDTVELTARVNGDVWSHSSGAHRQFTAAEVLAWASWGEDLHPGEVLALGTPPGGCGAELDRWIAPGDVVELVATGIGTLRNPIGQPERTPAAGLPSYTGAPRYRPPHS